MKRLLAPLLCLAPVAFAAPALAQPVLSLLERPGILLDRTPRLDVQSGLLELEVRHAADGSFRVRLLLTALALDPDAPGELVPLSTDPAIDTDHELLVTLPEGLEFDGRIVAVRAIYSSSSVPLLELEAEGEAPGFEPPRRSFVHVDVEPEELVVERALGTVAADSPLLSGKTQAGVVTIARGRVAGGAFHRTGTPFEFRDAFPAVTGYWTTFELEHVFDSQAGYTTHFAALSP